MGFRVVNRTTIDAPSTVNGLRDYLTNLPFPDNATIVEVEAEDALSMANVSPTLRLTIEWDVITGPEPTG